MARGRASEVEAGSGHPNDRRCWGAGLNCLKSLMSGVSLHGHEFGQRMLPSAKHHQHLPLKGASSARRFALIRSTAFAAATFVLERPAPRAACLRPYASSRSRALQARQHAVSHCPNSVLSRDVLGWSSGVGQMCPLDGHSRRERSSAPLTATYNLHAQTGQTRLEYGV